MKTHNFEILADNSRSFGTTVMCLPPFPSPSRGLRTSPEKLFTLSRVSLRACLAPNQTPFGATKHVINPKGVLFWPVLESTKGGFRPWWFSYLQVWCNCHLRQLHEKLPSSWDLQNFFNLQLLIYSEVGGLGNKVEGSEMEAFCKT